MFVCVVLLYVVCSMLFIWYWLFCLSGRPKHVRQDEDGESEAQGDRQGGSVPGPGMVPNFTKLSVVPMGGWPFRTVSPLNHSHAKSHVDQHVASSQAARQPDQAAEPRRSIISITTIITTISIGNQYYHDYHYYYYYYLPQLLLLVITTTIIVTPGGLLVPVRFRT